jgi:hypothetical protein
MTVADAAEIADIPTLSPAIPEFQKDAEAIAAYDDARARFEIDASIEAEDRTHATFTKRRAGIRAEIDATATLLYERREIAEKALWEYANRYPLRVDDDTPRPPSFWETIWSFGHAGLMYKRALVSAAEATQVHSRRRRLEQSYDELDEQLQRALFLQEDARKRNLDAPDGLAEFHARPDIAPLRARVEEIETERAQYAARLAAGGVADSERRDRDFAQHRISRLEAPFDGVTIVRVMRYGTLSYFILRDLEGNLYALGYEPRLEPLIDRVFDVYWLAEGFDVRATVSRAGRPVTIAEHYAATFRDPEDARYEYEKARAALSGPRTDIPAMTFQWTLDPAGSEQDLIDLLAGFAEVASGPKESLASPT